MVCLNLAEELSKKRWSEPPGADGAAEEKPQRQEGVLGACETPAQLPSPSLGPLGMDMGKQSFTRMQTRARHSRAPACRGLGIEDWFDGKDANSQIHSCLDREVNQGLGLEGGEWPGASS